MRAALKGAWVVGTPDAPDVFQYSYNVDVTVVDDEGIELPGTITFCFEVVSTRWIDRQLQQNNVMIGRHFLVIPNDNLTLVDTKLRDYINSITGATIEEIAEKLEKIGASHDFVPHYQLEGRHFL